MNYVMHNQYFEKYNVMSYLISEAVISALVSQGPVSDPWRLPIQDIRESTGLSPTEICAWVTALRDTGTVLPYSVVVNGEAVTDHPYEWSRPEEYRLREIG